MWNFDQEVMKSFLIMLRETKIAHPKNGSCISRRDTSKGGPATSPALHLGPVFLIAWSLLSCESTQSTDSEEPCRLTE
jgi:hypothetical protein